MSIPEKYLVVAVRKSDGQTFFPDNPRHRKGISDYMDAEKIAKHKASTLSEDYYYVVYRCIPVAGYEKDDPPVREISLTINF